MRFPPGMTIVTDSETTNLGAKRIHLPECESVRGIAILLVLLFHGSRKWSPGSRIEAPNIAESYISAGDTGVILFFVLSGFLLSLPFIRSKEIGIKHFAINRGLRILPLYTLVIAAGAIYHQDLYGFLQALFFWDITVATLPPFGSVGWSLMTEVQFYCCLPFVFFLWNGRQTRPLIVFLLVGLICTYLDISGRWNLIEGDWSLGLNLRNTIFARWPSFLCGILLGAIYIHQGSRIETWISRRAAFKFGAGDLLLLSQAVILGLVLQKVANLSVMAAYVTFFDRFLLESILWTGILATILLVPLKTRVLFVNPILHFFGTISYSLYLLHLVALIFVVRALTLMQLGLSHHEKISISIVVAIAVSTLTHRIIEKPFIAMKRKRQ